MRPVHLLLPLVMLLLNTFAIDKGKAKSFTVELCTSAETLAITGENCSTTAGQCDKFDGQCFAPLEQSFTTRIPKDTGSISESWLQKVKEVLGEMQLQVQRNKNGKFRISVVDIKTKEVLYQRDLKKHTALIYFSPPKTKTVLKQNASSNAATRKKVAADIFNLFAVKLTLINMS